MSAIDRMRIYNNRSSTHDTDLSGYALAAMGDKPTHAVCRHGVITKAGDNHHPCRWQWLVRDKLQEK